MTNIVKKRGRVENTDEGGGCNPQDTEIVQPSSSELTEDVRAMFRGKHSEDAQGHAAEEQPAIPWILERDRIA